VGGIEKSRSSILSHFIHIARNVRLLSSTTSHTVVLGMGDEERTLSWDSNVRTTAGGGELFPRKNVHPHILDPAGGGAGGSLSKKGVDEMTEGVVLGEESADP